MTSESVNRTVKVMYAFTSFIQRKYNFNSYSQGVLTLLIRKRQL